MTDRESRDRLVELIDKAVKQDEFMYPADVETASIADHLLANGIIVPPCKVGDVLWIPSAYPNKVYSKVIKEILIHEKDGEIGKYVYASSAYFPFENIGKTVFLTKEEAEEKLKELKDNG
jgi:hypothetical protein